MTSDKDNLKNHASETRDARTDGHSVSAAQSASAPSRPVPQYLTTELVLPKAVREQFEAEQAAARAAQAAAEAEAAAKAAAVESASEPIASATAASAPTAAEKPSDQPRHARRNAPKHAASKGFAGVPTVEELYAAGSASAKHKAASAKVPLMADLIGAEEARKRAEAVPVHSAAPSVNQQASASRSAEPTDSASADRESQDAAASAAKAANFIEASAEAGHQGESFVSDSASSAEAEFSTEAYEQESADFQEDSGFSSDGESAEADLVAESDEEDADVPEDEAAESQEGEELESEEDAEEDAEDGAEQEPARRTSLSLAWRVAGIVFCVVLAVCGISLGTYGYDRWLHGNDETNFQGTWQIEDSKATVTITDKQIIFADDAIYDYKMDSTTKSLTLKLAGLSGQAHYCFSFDKDTLVFADGDPGTALTSAANDFPWWLAQIGEEVLSINSSKAVPDGAVVLHRSA